MQNTRIHPGEILNEILEANGSNVETLADALHLPSVRLAMIVDGRRGISPDVALRLAKYFDTTPHFWMTLQNSYDLAVAAENRPLAA